MRSLYLISILIILAIIAGMILYYGSSGDVAGIVTPTPSELDLEAKIDLLGGSVSKNFSE